jgi:pimeloyl-ACP methyl ester carboxylesterase
MMLKNKSYSRKTILKIISAILGILVLIFLLIGYLSKSRLAKNNPAPGALVDIGGYKMHIYCIGQGSPTVIMEAGLKDFSVFWSRVQPELAKTTRVCVYDRAGYGWSENSPNQRTIENITAELHVLVTNSFIEKPFVLVGHSYGGAIARLYANMYPDDVTGMVWVDAAHEDLFFNIPELLEADDQVLKMFKSLERLTLFGILAMAPDNIPNRGLPANVYEQYKAILASTNYFETAIAESLLFEESLNTVRDLHDPSLGDIPLIVISRGVWDPLPNLSEKENEQAWLAWQNLQTDLLQLSKNSRQMVATNSGHEIQLQQPEVVIKAILEVVDQIEK